MDLKSCISFIREVINDSVTGDPNTAACPRDFGLDMMLCDATPGCTCRQCWELAITFALKGEGE